MSENRRLTAPKPPESHRSVSSNLGEATTIEKGLFRVRNDGTFVRTVPEEPLRLDTDELYCLPLNPDRAFLPGDRDEDRPGNLFSQSVKVQDTPETDGGGWLQIGRDPKLVRVS